MDLTPHSSSSPRSSVSPDPFKASSPFNYPSPMPSEANSSGPYHHIPQGLGLGIYNCSTSAPPHSIDDSMVPVHADLGSEWTASALQARRGLHSPHIFSTDTDDFALPVSNMNSSYSPRLYTARVATSSVPCTSPSLSCIESSRSSISSHTSEPYPVTDHYHVPPPQTLVKMEDQLQDWPNNMMSRSHSQAEESILMAPPSSFPGSFDSSFYVQQNPVAWGQSDSFGGDKIFTDAAVTQFSTNHAQNQNQERRRIGSAATRTKAPRRMTTREDANFQCTVKGCGKLFSRSYNYKAHLETHSNNREYPFPCEVSGCTKKFVRKTDLQRHNASVHEKIRNYQCDYCSRFFARKDTLRRHMEDGCPKRFDLNMNFNSSSYTTSEMVKSESQATTQRQAQLMNIQSPYGAAGVSSYTSIPQRALPEFNPELMVHNDYSHQQGSAWGQHQ